MDFNELVEVVKNNGIVGAGGAGFSTYAKLDKRADAIILNSAECEPLLKVHRQLLQKYAYEIMSTLCMIAEAVKASTIIIAVKETYTDTVESVRANQESFPNIQLKLLSEQYPMGDEVVLIYETMGKVVPPGSIPIDVGVTVFNVETILNVYKAVYKQKPVCSTYLTIAGEVKDPLTIKVPIGMSVNDVVKLAGGATIKDPAYLMGGPMTGTVVRSFDVVKKTTNAILVLPKNHTVIQRKLSDTSIDMKRAMSVCCQCEMCTDLCPRHQLGHPVTPHMFMRAATSGVTKDLAPYLDTMFCSSCGVCEMYACPQTLSPRKLITEYKTKLRQKGIQVPKDIPLKKVDPMRDYRKLPEERLIARLGLADYNIDAPLQERKVTASLVKIYLNQHIGVKSQAVVKVKDKVKKGDEIAIAEEGKLSLPVHSSISGEIQEINDNFIIIKSE